MSGFTKQAIQASFLKLLDTYPLRDITVRMITEDCGINRKSFYYHDQDISTSSAPSAKARPNTSSAASTPVWMTFEATDRTPGAVHSGTAPGVVITSKSSRGRWRRSSGG